MKDIALKFHRTVPGDLASYGPLVIKRLDQFAGGSNQWNMSQYHGTAIVPGTKIRIERHEDGPEFWNLVITQLPNYVSAIAAVASAWLAYKASKGEQRTVKLRIGKHSYEGPVRNAQDVKDIVAALKSLK